MCQSIFYRTLEDSVNIHSMSNFEQYRCWWNWNFNSSEDFRYFFLDWKNCFIIISFWIKKHSSCLKKVAVCLDSSPVVASSPLLFLRDVFHLLLTHNTKLLPLEEDQKLCRGAHLKLVLGVTAVPPTGPSNAILPPSIYLHGIWYLAMIQKGKQIQKQKQTTWLQSV